jgi:hypothetical protein
VLLTSAEKSYEHVPERIESCGARGFVRKEHLPRVDFSRFWRTEGAEMDDEQTVERPIDRVRCVLDAEFRTGAEIAEHLGMSRAVVGGPLGTLRRRGEAEGKLGPRGESLWRKAPEGDPHRTPAAESAAKAGEERQIGMEPEPTSPRTPLAARFGRST